MISSKRRKGKTGEGFTVALTERQQINLAIELSAKEGKGDDSGEEVYESKRIKKAQLSPVSRINRPRNKSGETLLHLAATKGDLETAKNLIKQSADVNCKDNADWTPLHEACNHGHYKIAKLLLKAGANVNVTGYDGDTPLHDASTNGHLKVVLLLLRHGGDPHVKNKKGISPVDVAEGDDIDEALRNFTKDMLADLKHLKEYTPEKTKHANQINSSSVEAVSKTKSSHKQHRRFIRNIADFLDTDSPDQYLDKPQKEPAHDEVESRYARAEQQDHLQRCPLDLSTQKKIEIEKRDDESKPHKTQSVVSKKFNEREFKDVGENNDRIPSDDKFEGQKDLSKKDLYEFIQKDRIKPSKVHSGLFEKHRDEDPSKHIDEPKHKIKFNDLARKTELSHKTDFQSKSQTHCTKYSMIQDVSGTVNNKKLKAKQKMRLKKFVLSKNEIKQEELVRAVNITKDDTKHKTHDSSSKSLEKEDSKMTRKPLESPMKMKVHQDSPNVIKKVPQKKKTFLRVKEGFLDDSEEELVNKPEEKQTKEVLRDSNEMKQNKISAEKNEIKQNKISAEKNEIKQNKISAEKKVVKQDVNKYKDSKPIKIKEKVHEFNVHIEEMDPNKLKHYLHKHKSFKGKEMEKDRDRDKERHLVTKEKTYENHANENENKGNSNAFKDGMNIQDKNPIKPPLVSESKLNDKPIRDSPAKKSKHFDNGMETKDSDATHLKLDQPCTDKAKGHISSERALLHKDGHSIQYRRSSEMPLSGVSTHHIESRHSLKESKATTKPLHQMDAKVKEKKEDFSKVKIEFNALESQNIERSTHKHQHLKEKRKDSTIEEIPVIKSEVKTESLPPHVNENSISEKVDEKVASVKNPLHEKPELMHYSGVVSRVSSSSSWNSEKVVPDCPKVKRHVAIDDSGKKNFPKDGTSKSIDVKKLQKVKVDKQAKCANGDNIERNISHKQFDVHAVTSEIRQATQLQNNKQDKVPVHEHILACGPKIEKKLKTESGEVTRKKHKRKSHDESSDGKKSKRNDVVQTDGRHSVSDLVKPGTDPLKVLPSTAPNETDQVMPKNNFFGKVKTKIEEQSVSSEKIDNGKQKFNEKLKDTKLCKQIVLEKKQVTLSETSKDEKPSIDFEKQAKNPETVEKGMLRSKPEHQKKDDMLRKVQRSDEMKNLGIKELDFNSILKVHHDQGIKKKKRKRLSDAGKDVFNEAKIPKHIDDAKRKDIEKKLPTNLPEKESIIHINVPPPPRPHVVDQVDASMSQRSTTTNKRTEMQIFLDKTDQEENAVVKNKPSEELKFDKEKVMSDEKAKVNTTSKKHIKTDSITSVDLKDVQLNDKRKSDLKHIEEPSEEKKDMDKRGDEEMNEENENAVGHLLSIENDPDSDTCHDMEADTYLPKTVTTQNLYQCVAKNQPLHENIESIYSQNIDEPKLPQQLDVTDVTDVTEDSTQKIEDFSMGNSCENINDNVSGATEDSVCRQNEKLDVACFSQQNETRKVDEFETSKVYESINGESCAPFLEGQRKMESTENLQNVSQLPLLASSTLSVEAHAPSKTDASKCQPTIELIQKQLTNEMPGQEKGAVEKVLNSEGHNKNSLPHSFTEFRLDLSTDIQLKHEQYPGLISPSTHAESHNHYHDLDTIDPSDLLKTESAHVNEAPDTSISLTRCLSPDEIISKVADCIIELGEHQNAYQLQEYVAKDAHVSQDMEHNFQSAISSTIDTGTFTLSSSVDTGLLLKNAGNNHQTVFAASEYDSNPVFTDSFSENNSMSNSASHPLFINTVATRLSSSEEKLYSPKHISAGERLYSPRTCADQDDGKQNQKVDIEPCSILSSIINSGLTDISTLEPIVKDKKDTQGKKKLASEMNFTKENSPDISKIKRLRTWREAIKQRCSTVGTDSFKSDVDTVLTPVTFPETYNDIIDEAKNNVHLHNMLISHAAQKEKLRVSMIQELARIDCNCKLMSQEKGPIAASTVIYFQRDQSTRNLSRTLDFKNKSSHMPDFKKLRDASLANLQDKYEKLVKDLLDQQRLEMETLKIMQKFEDYDYNEVLRKRYWRLKSKLS